MKHAPTHRQSHRNRLGLSLLEVMLTLAILGVAVAILAQAMNLAADNGNRARDIMSAQLACESKMAEIVAGAVPMTAASWAPIPSSGSTKSWYYQVVMLAAEQPNMMGVQVSITDSPNGEFSKPVEFKLVRWIIDPNLGLDSLPTTTPTTGGSSTGSASGTTSTSGGSR